MTDYKTLHLTWIRRHEKYVPKGGYLFDDVPYYELMADMYRVQPACTQACAKMFYDADIKWADESEKINNEIVKQVLQTDKDHLAPIFVTIGFNHQTWNISSCVKVIKNIVSFDWIQSIRAVFELHRENGQHPHVHMLITLSPHTDKKNRTKSKVLEKIWATAGIKNVVQANNGRKCSTFVDYKVAQDWHHKYILLEKCDAKMPYVFKDIKWRKDNAIDEYFEKE